MITIREPQSFSRIGGKDNQEDYLYPEKGSRDTRVFILCDGIGGHDKGEVASKVVATTLGCYLKSHEEVTLSVLEKGVESAYNALDALGSTFEKKQPGTTMTCLCLNNNSYIIGHIGDSRVYHIRPSLYSPTGKRGGIIYQTSDHSLVNDLLKAGVISKEEALVSPQKSVLTKSMQPSPRKRYKATAYQFDDVESGDYFILCSDGALEYLTNEQLCGILARPDLDDEEKLAEIERAGEGRNRDNYSCWLIPVEKVAIEAGEAISPVIMAEEEYVPHQPQEQAARPNQPNYVRHEHRYQHQPYHRPQRRVQQQQSSDFDDIGDRIMRKVNNFNLAELSTASMLKIIGLLIFIVFDIWFVIYLVCKIFA